MLEIGCGYTSLQKGNGKKSRNEMDRRLTADIQKINAQKVRFKTKQEKTTMSQTKKIAEANKILDIICSGCCWTEREKETLKCQIKTLREVLNAN